MSDAQSEAPHTRPAPSRPASVLAGLYLFGIGFGFVEAVVVVDLRAILGPKVDRIVGHSSDDRFPMIPFDRLVKDDPSAARLLRIELLREAATLVTLAGVGLAAGRSFIGRFAAFLVGFGVWDLVYYLVPEAVDRLAGVGVDVGRALPDPGPLGRAGDGAGDRRGDDGRGGLGRDRRGIEGPAVPGLAMGLDGDRRGRPRPDRGLLLGLATHRHRRRA